MSTIDPVVFLSFARTPMGGMLGELASLSATQLGAVAVKGAVDRSGLTPEQIERCYMGCVLPAGLGQAPARQAAIFGGLPNTVEATTINKMCGSAMQAAIMASDALAAGSADIIVAGGMESMTNAPYLNLKHRAGARIGHDKLYDHMFLDGLEDVYEQGKLMGNFAEDVAQEYQFTREKQDAFAIASLGRALDHANKLANEIVPVTVKTRKGDVVIDSDEQPRNANVAKIPTLKPAFAKDGTITAANASSISDGAAALVMTRMSVADKLGVKPIARVVSHAAFAHAPAKFTTAPVGSSRRALEKAGWTTKDVDLFEVNEAFATVAMIAMHDLGVPHDVLNIHGGACALGHPVGASGARILGALINGLQVNGLKRGLASICLGGGRGDFDGGGTGQLKLGRLNHVGVATPSIEKSVAYYRNVMGAETIGDPFDMPSQGVKVCFVDAPNFQVELIEPLGESSPIHGFLAKNPAGGQHHMCYEVPDIHEAKAWFEGKGAKVLGEPRIGAHGTPIFFVHPKDMNGVLTEIMETPREGAH